MKKILFITLGAIVAVCSYFLFFNTHHQKSDDSLKTSTVEDETIMSENNNEKAFKQEQKSYSEILLEEMSLEEKVGQMFIVRCPDEYAVKKVSEYHIGGYILFAKDFENETKASMKKTIESYQNVANIPLFIGVDEEGGTVNRVSCFKAFRDIPFYSPQVLYKKGGMALIKSDTTEKCNLLKSIGINMNFAPVSDISVHSKDFMYKRTFGKNANETAKYVETVVSEMNKNNVVSVLKHFPGYGNNNDTHTGIAYDKRSYDHFESSDFIPFLAGIDAGSNVILVSHNIVESMDKEYPASLSKKVHDILREDLNYDGLTITDDLVMSGVKDFANNEEVAVLAVLAGNDLLCCTDFEEQIPAVIHAVEENRIDEEIINRAVLKILDYKLKMGILKEK